MWASTFSIVACDLDNREWGVALASKFLAIGALSAWAEPEVGAVATQAWIRTAYGEEGLGLLAGGASAQEALDRLLAEDPESERRQVGIIDAAGDTASHTGPGCLEWAGERSGPHWLALGNMLVSADTLDALARAFEAHEGQPLAERLLAALAAAESAGGDRRGRQAAALRIAKRGGGYGGANALVDLRVDDHTEPVTELERLYGLHRLYFGFTPEEQWHALEGTLREEVRERLERLGYASGDLAADLETWAGVENLEERVQGAERLDPVVLDQLRSAESA